MTAVGPLRLGRRAERPAPLSSAQARLWFLHQLRPDSSEYHLQIAYRLRGRLDAAALEAALDDVVRRHEPLRTVIASGPEGRPVQQVLPATTPLVRRTAPGGATAHERATALAAEEIAAPFDLAARPPLRACLAVLGDDDHALAVTMHHVAFDGWSTGIFLSELVAGYNSRVAGAPSQQEVLPLAYSDYAWWEQESLAADEQRLLRYWRDALSGCEDLELPADRGGFGVGGDAGFARRKVDPSTTQRLQALARTEATTLFTVALAAWQALLHRYTGQRTFAVGFPVAGRSDVALEPLIGCFVNTLCLPAHVAGPDSFRNLVRATRETLASAIAHQALPFERLVHELRPGRAENRNPLFRAFCTYIEQPFQVEQPSSPLALDGVEAELVLPAYERWRFELSATFTFGADGLFVQLEYSRTIFDDATVERLARHLTVLLDWAAVQPDQAVEDLPLMLPAERRQVLVLLNG